MVVVFRGVSIKHQSLQHHFEASIPSRALYLFQRFLSRCWFFFFFLIFLQQATPPIPFCVWKVNTKTSRNQQWRFCLRPRARLYCVPRFTSCVSLGVIEKLVLHLHTRYPLRPSSPPPTPAHPPQKGKMVAVPVDRGTLLPLRTRRQSVVFSPAVSSNKVAMAQQWTWSKFFTLRTPRGREAIHTTRVRW